MLDFCQIDRFSCLGEVDGRGDGRGGWQVWYRWFGWTSFVWDFSRIPRCRRFRSSILHMLPWRAPWTCHLGVFWQALLPPPDVEVLSQRINQGSKGEAYTQHCSGTFIDRKCFVCRHGKVVRSRKIWGTAGAAPTAWVWGVVRFVTVKTLIRKRYCFQTIVSLHIAPWIVEFKKLGGCFGKLWNLLYLDSGQTS